MSIHTHLTMKIFLPLVKTILAAGVVAIMACGGSQGETLPSAIPTPNLSKSEITALHDLAQQLDDEGNLRPAVPLYLPSGLAHFPFESLGSPEGSTLLFGRGADVGSDPLIAIQLILSQGYSDATIIMESPFVDLDGVQASAQAPPPGDGMALYTLTFSIRDRDFLVSVTWEAPDEVLSDEMKAQTVLIARSIIEDYHQEGLQ